MIRWLKELDRVLRGDATRLAALRQGSINIPAGGMAVVVVLLGAFYGVCMGCYAIVSGRGGEYLQLLASTIKVPALFVLTLIVTFPSLYVFNALVGSKLSLPSLVRLLIAAMSVMLALLASFGTIVAFFSFTTDSYHFMVVLNVVVFALSGFLGLSFLLQTLHRLSVADEMPEKPMPLPAAAEVLPVQATEEASERPPLPEIPPLHVDRSGALDRLEGQAISRNVRRVFIVWILVFGLVGAQMSWVLRPFIGGGTEFALFRARGGNFFEAVGHHVSSLFGKDDGNKSKSKR